jgi:hypothetical protein
MSNERISDSFAASVERRLKNFETVVTNLQARTEAAADVKLEGRVRALERRSDAGMLRATEMTETWERAISKRLGELEGSLGMFREELNSQRNGFAKSRDEHSERLRKLEEPTPEPMGAAPLRMMPLEPWRRLLTDVVTAPDEWGAEREDESLGADEIRRLRAQVEVALEAVAREEFRQAPHPAIPSTHGYLATEPEPEGITITFDSDRQPRITIRDFPTGPNAPTVLEFAQFLRQSRALVMVDTGGYGKQMLAMLLSHNVQAIPLPKTKRG